MRRFDRLDVLFSVLMADVFIDKMMFTTPKEDFLGWVIFLLAVPVLVWLWVFKLR